MSLRSDAAQGEEDDRNAGFSLVAVDGSSVSWRFKPLASPWPFVLITRPTDRRLVTDSSSPQQVPVDGFVVCAKVFGNDVRTVTVSVDDGKPLRMRAVENEPGVWSAQVPLPDTDES